MTLPKKDGELLLAGGGKRKLPQLVHIVNTAYHVVGKRFWQQSRRGGVEGPLLHLLHTILGHPLARISQ